MKTMLDSFETNKIENALLAVIAVLLCWNYFILQPVYRMDDVDDTWALHDAYSLVVNGTPEDSAFVGFYAQGATKGAEYFKKTYALFYGNILTTTEWTYTQAQRISTLLVFLSGGLWLLILKKMSFDRAFRNTFVVLFFLLEFSFMAASNLRTEAISLFIQTSAFYFFVSGRYFAAGFLLVVGIELHPIAVLGFAYPAALVFGRSRGNPEARTAVFGRNQIFWLIMGGCLGVGYYLLLHFDILHNLGDYLVDTTSTGHQAGNAMIGALGEYFFKTKYFRHLPELFIFLYSLYTVWRGRAIENRQFLLSAFLIQLPLSFLRPNFNYVILIYPSMILIIAAAFRSMNRKNALFALMICLLAPQYIAAWHINKDWDRKSYVEAVERLNPKDELTIVGSATSWYGLMKVKNFKCAFLASSIFERLRLREFYLIDDQFVRSKAEYAPLMGYIRSHYQETVVRQIDVKGAPIILKKMTIKN